MFGEVAFAGRRNGAFHTVTEFLPFADRSLLSGDGAASKSLEPGLYVLGEQFVVAIHGRGSRPFVMHHEVGTEPAVRLLLQPFDLHASRW